MQGNALEASTEVYSMCKILGSLLLLPRRYLCLMPVLALVNVHHYDWKMGQMHLSVVMP